MTRRLAPLALALAFAAPAFADDAPPWAQPAPSAPAGASGAAAPDATDQALAFVDLKAIEDPELGQRMRGMQPEKRNALLLELWQGLRPDQKARVRYAADHLRENGAVATQRAAAMVAIGPPEEIHSEASRAWSGAVVEKIDDLAQIVKRLRGEKAPAGAPTLTLSGNLPTEVWVYPGATVNALRVVTFVDDDGDGTYRFVRDESVTAGTSVSSAPGVEPPPELFPPASTAASIEALPVLTKSGLPLKTSQACFKASAGRTFTRFMVAVDPDDVDLELGGDPAIFGATAEAWLRLEQGGAAVWQGKVSLKDSGATATDPWLAEISVPLIPGKYQATAAVIDAGKTGGTATWEAEVPGYAAGIALSSAVVTKVGPEGPPAAPPAPADGALAPFQVGNYIVKPAADGTFKRGDTLAFVVQVYNAPKATIECDLYRDGVYQSSLEPGEIKALPSTQIILQDLTKDFQDGAYELRVKVKNPANGADAADTKIPFRVRG